MVTLTKASPDPESRSGHLSFMRMGLAGRTVLAMVLALILWSAILPGLS